jgi:CheY-like chemotaxis protein
VPTILLADDSTHAQRMGAKILSAEGVDVVAVSNGDAAVKKLHELDVDLVLADVYMPGLDGYEVCERIKGSADYAGLPVVLLVGALEPYEPDRIAQVHADGVLRKPFEASAVLETVRPLLQASLEARARRQPPPPPPVVEQTIAIPPPKPPAADHTDTVEIPVFDSTVRIEPPAGAHDAAPPTAPVAATPKPAPAPVPVKEPAPPPVAPMASEPEPQPEPQPEMEWPQPSAPTPAAHAAVEEMPPPMADMVDVEIPVEIPVNFEAQSDEGSVADFSLPSSSDEYAPGEFAIPDIGESTEESMDAGAFSAVLDTAAAAPAKSQPPAKPEEPAETPRTPKWVVEPVPVAPEDHARFADVAAPETPKPDALKPAKKAESQAPPDWGELLKSVEDTMGGSIPPPTAIKPAVRPSTPAPVAAAAAPAPVAEPVAAPAAAAVAPASDLELDIPAEEPPPPPPPPPAPTIDEDELRMAVQLCLESALPGLVDEITSAVLRRLKSQN